MACPECGSSKTYKDGLRYYKDGTARQRWLCRDCGYRFSQSCVKLNVAGKVRESSNSGKNHHKMGVASRDAINEKVDDCLPFAYSEDVAPHTLSITEKRLNSLPFYNRNIQVCAQKDAKNLDTTAISKIAAGETKKIDAVTAKGLLLQYELWLQKEGYGEKCRYRDCIRMLINSGADLYSPENVKKIIGKQKWKDGTKMQVCYAYDALTKMLKIE